MSETTLLWIFGLLCAWNVGQTALWQLLSTRVTRLEATLIAFSKDAANILHSPHTPELDALLEKYVDRSYELRHEEWERLLQICDEIVESTEADREYRTLAALLRQICRHKLFLPPEVLNKVRALP